MTTTASPAIGLTLVELAAHLGRSTRAVAELIEPFVVAGIVEKIDGVLVVTDSGIRAGFADERFAA